MTFRDLPVFTLVYYDIRRAVIRKSIGKTIGVTARPSLSLSLLIVYKSIRSITYPLMFFALLLAHYN